MESVVATVVPVFALVALGFIAGRSRYLGEAAAKGLPEFVFKLAMPVMLFRTVGTARMPDLPIGQILLPFFAGVLVVWLVAAIATPLLLRRPAADGASIGMASAFSNSVMMGIPIALSHFGEAAAPILAIIVLCDTAAMWLLATLHLAATELSGRRSMAGLLGNLGWRLVTNPVIVGCVAGLIWQQSGVAMPALANTVVNMLAGAAIPGALVAMGLALNSYSLSGQAASVGLIALLKLIVMPVVAYYVATRVLGLPTLASGVVTLLAAMPVGANAYLFANAYDRAPAAVSGAIALTTPLAFLTISLLLLALGTAGP